MEIIQELLNKGVNIPNHYSIEVGSEVRIDRIMSGATLHCGTKLYGSETYIGEGASIGYEAPTTIENCWVGPHVALKGGFFRKAVFLQGVSCGSGSHIREGTILEEHATIAHTVGLKQTILFPYVTLGSLINFCDCLMAGGTDRRNHSEVGSSYIHFNFTANQDKATASLIGDVPRGVMLNQSPIFLGGQGGLVGPCRIAFGTVLAAGSICRNDQLEENRIVFEGTAGKGSLPFKPGTFRNVKRVLQNNLYYIGNLIALQQWYRQIRSRFVGSECPAPLYEGLKTTLASCIQERLDRLTKMGDKMAETTKPGTLQHEFCQQWPEIEPLLANLQLFQGSSEKLAQFSETIESAIQTAGTSYLSAIQGLTPSQKTIGTQWLDSIVQNTVDEVIRRLPSLGNNKQ